MAVVNRSRDGAIRGILFFLKKPGSSTRIGPPPAPPRLNAVGAAALRAVAQGEGDCGRRVFGRFNFRGRWARDLLTRSLNLNPLVTSQKPCSLNCRIPPYTSSRVHHP